MRNFLKGFTLVEVMMALLVVSVILAVMAPALVPKVQKKTETESVKIVDTTPVGSIICWYGPNYPEGWLPLNGQEINPAYAELRKVLNNAALLPDMNAGLDPTENITWIIKARRVN